MKRLLKYTAILLMVLLTGSSVWAFNYGGQIAVSNQEGHITTAPNNKGDVLIFPWYLALDGGWNTKLTVINTDMTACVVAKVVIRSFKNSEELLDFLIYLSPGDVWVGGLKYLGGKTVLYSSDDSAVSNDSPLTFADKTPISKAMFPLDCTDDADYLGYVEVVMAAWKGGFSKGTAVTKDKIYNGYNGTGTAATSIGQMNYPAFFNPNCLAGYMELQNATLGLSTSLRSTTLKNNDTNEKLDTGPETKLGEKSRNNITEFEAALAKDSIAMPYVNQDGFSLHFFTFPTKLTQRATGCKSLTTNSPYFNAQSVDRNNATEEVQWCIDYTRSPYDLMENTPTSGPFSGAGGSDTFCSEVNFLSTLEYVYKEGWANYKFTVVNGGTFSGQNLARQPMAYSGSPVIPTFLYLTALGLEANYGAWTDTTTAGCVGNPATCYQLIDYQYTDSAVQTIVN